MQDQEQAVAGLQLAALITKHRERTRESFKEMAARGGLPTTTLSNLATNPLKQMPQRENLDKVAKALRVDVSVVIRAAGEACDLVVYEDESLPDDPDTRAIMVTTGLLTPEQRRLMLLQAQAWVKDNIS